MLSSFSQIEKREKEGDNNHNYHHLFHSNTTKEKDNSHCRHLLFLKQREKERRQ
jgi:hypothetical protein